ncbi:hypothetical protein [Sinosporangium siamense]|uniref:Uncharacterized protein n=1 Tax=Sinosporangium siamense TaxID=1367973 RepID=A0A919RJV2_9ACTN|nr:hypothetical protein [Sinosporangium siamense]GII95185.1 hypothetical protein Ssi02_54160 [Sinosporangium siamense]
MKAKGFKYIAFVAPDQETELQRRVANGDYEAVKQFRSKYGYQTFARYIYPDDPSSGALVPPEDPNLAVSINNAHQEAFMSAKDACETEAVKVVLGKVVKSRMDLFQHWMKSRKAALDREARLARRVAAFGCGVRQSRRLSTAEVLVIHAGPRPGPPGSGEGSQRTGHGSKITRSTILACPYGDNEHLNGWRGLSLVRCER